MARSAEANVVKYPARDPFDFPPNTDKVAYMGVDYNFRDPWGNPYVIAVRGIEPASSTCKRRGAAFAVGRT